MRYQNFVVCLLLLTLVAPRILYAEPDGDKGDITVGGGGGTWAIDPDTITNAKLSNMFVGTIKGRATAGLGDPEDLTGTQATSLLNTFTTSLKGVVPASGGGTTNFLRADGTWAPAGGGSGSIADDAVTNAKLANMATATMKGRVTAGTGDPEDLSLAQIATLLGYQPLDADLTTLAGKTIVGTGTNVRLSTGSFATNDCVKVDASGNLATAGAACGTGGGAGLTKVITDAVDEASAMIVGGLVYKKKMWGNATEGVVEKIEPSQNVTWVLAEGFNAYWRDHLAATILRIEESTKTVYFSGPIVTAAGEATLGIPFTAVGTKKVSAFNSDGTFTLADDVQPVIVHGAPSAGSCIASNDVFIDDTSVPPALYFCKVAGGNPIDIATLGNGYVIVSDGTHTASATGAEQLSLAGDPGGILTPLVTPGTPDTFKYTFATQAANRVLKGPNTGSPAIPTFAALVEADLPATALTQTSNSALTNKIVDAEGTGNIVTAPIKLWLPVARCQNATASLLLDTETTNPPVAACITGTNTQKGVADFDPTTDQCLQTSVQLPADFTGAIDVRYVWLAAATSGTTGWCSQFTSTAAGETDDPAFPAQAAGNCISDTANGVANQLNLADQTGITASGVAAGELLHIRLCRDANGSAVTDSMTGNARLVGLELTYRRAM